MSELSAVDKTVTSMLFLLPARYQPDDHYHGSIKAQCREKFRLLKVKIPVRRLGAQDSIEHRAAVCLEHVLRKGAANVRVPPEELAKAVGAKPKAFRELHDKLDHFLSSSSKSSRSGSARSRDNNNTTTTTKEDDDAARASSFRRLSLRMAARAPHHAAVRAEALFQRLRTAYETDTGYHRAVVLEDFRRKRDVYTSACFYLACRDGPQEDAVLLAAVVTASQLTEREFRRVLAHAEGTVGTWERRPNTQKKKNGTVQKGRDPYRKRNHRVAFADGTANNDEEKDGAGAAHDFVNAVTASHNDTSDDERLDPRDNTNHNKRIDNDITTVAHDTLTPSCDLASLQDDDEPSPDFSPAYLAWRTNILDEAKAAARQRMATTTTTPWKDRLLGQGGAISDAQALMFAADQTVATNEQARPVLYNDMMT